MHLAFAIFKSGSNVVGIDEKQPRLELQFLFQHGKEFHSLHGILSVFINLRFIIFVYGKCSKAY